jgi:hypothetical protein
VAIDANSFRAVEELVCRILSSGFCLSRSVSY